MLAMAAFVLGQADVTQAADANPPERMTYQGYLVDGNGGPLGNSAPTNYDVVFRIYVAKTGGEPLWAEQQTVTVDKGYFSVLLGEGSKYNNENDPALSTVFQGAAISDRFIGITVDTGGGTVEIAPRLRLVTSPYAFTATQARNVSDGSGNRNLFREVDSNNNASLKLGAGSTPTLTLQESGDATLAGKLTIDLPEAGVGLEIKEQGTSTKFGGLNGDRFSMSTARGGFHFDKSIYVDGDIYSFNRDARLYPSDNTDNFLNVNHEGDTIDAYTDRFYVRDPSKYLEINPTSSSVDFNTDAGGFYMNKPLTVDGALTASSLSMSGNMTIESSDSGEAVLSLHGSAQGTGRLYLGQSATYGGGIIYNGDGTPDFAGGTTDNISFYRTINGVHSEVFRYPYNSNTVTFNGDIGVSGSLLVYGDMGLRSVTGSYGTVQTTGSGAGGWAGYSIGGRYVFMSRDNDQFGIYNDVDNRWVTLYEKAVVSGGRYRVALNEELVLNLQHTNGTRYASYDGDLNWDFYSDRRLKENIVKEDHLLDRIMQLDVVNYDFISEKKKEHKELGFIAQEVEPLFPSLVSEQEDDRYDFKVKSLGYSSFGVVALGGIKELKLQKDAEIASLKQEVETLKSEMAVLKASLAANKTSETRLAKLEALVARMKDEG